jgi:hypothetical protein
MQKRSKAHRNPPFLTLSAKLERVPGFGRSTARASLGLVELASFSKSCKKINKSPIRSLKGSLKLPQIKWFYKTISEKYGNFFHHNSCKSGAWILFIID